MLLPCNFPQWVMECTPVAGMHNWNNKHFISPTSLQFFRDDLTENCIHTNTLQLVSDKWMNQMK